MKSIAFFVLFLISGLVAFAQSDSVNVSAAKPEFDFMYRELFNFSPTSTFGALQLQPEAPMLENKFQLNNGFTINYNPFSPNRAITLSNQFPIFNPFVTSLSINSEGAYQLNDRFMFGGNSFSGNSIFDPLPANPSLQDMSIRGATMFLQYKLSKSVKVSGSISVTNQDRPFVP